MLHLIMRATIKCGVGVQNKLVYANRTQNKGWLDGVGLGGKWELSRKPTYFQRIF